MRHDRCAINRLVSNKPGPVASLSLITLHIRRGEHACPRCEFLRPSETCLEKSLFLRAPGRLSLPAEKSIGQSATTSKGAIDARESVAEGEQKTSNFELQRISSTERFRNIDQYVKRGN